MLKINNYVVIILLLFVFSCKQDSVIDNAIECFDNKDYLEVISICDSLNDLSNNHKLLMLRGKSFYHLGNSDLALRDFTTLINGWSDIDTNVYLLRAECYNEIHLYQGAIGDYNRVLSIDSMNIRALLARAKIYSLLGEYVLASRDWKFLLSIDSKKDLWNSNLGLVYENLLEYDKAVYYYTLAIDNNKFEGFYYFNRGVSFMYLDKYDLAIRDFNSAITLNPYNGLFYLERGKAYFLISRISLSCDDWKTAIDLGEDEAKSLIEKHCNTNAFTI